jgi:hypothetical protein
MARGRGVLGPFDPAASRLSGHIRFAQRKQVGASNSKTRGRCTRKGVPLRGIDFMSELKLRPTRFDWVE